MNKLIKISLALLITLSIVGCGSKCSTQEDLDAKMALVIQKGNRLKDQIRADQKAILVQKFLEIQQIQKKIEALPENKQMQATCDFADDMLELLDEMIADL